MATIEILQGKRLRTGVAAMATASVLLTACGGVQTSTGGSGNGSGKAWPSGPVEMYVGASAGGSSDLISRAVSRGLGDALGGSFPVINREGANGALAAAEIAKAKSDGSVIGIQNASLFTITPLAVAPGEVTTIDDFDVVYGVSRDDYVLVTNPASPYKTVDDLKKATGTVRYGTTGVGTGAQLASALFFKVGGVKSTPVPFDGGAPALAAILGNQIDAATMQIGEAVENVKSGKLLPLAVFSKDRVSALPDIPTAKEQGVDVEVSQYRFMTVPKGTPEDIQESIVEGLKKTYATDDYKKFNEQNNLTPMEIPGDEVLAELKEDQQRNADLVKQYSIDLAQK